MHVNNVRATLRGGNWLSATADARGEGGKPTQVVNTKLVIELEDNEGDLIQALVEVLPGFDDFIHQMYGDEETLGFDMTTRGKLQDMTLTVSHGDEEVFHQANCPVVAKVKIGFNRKKDELKATLRIKVKLSAKEQAALSNLMDADIAVTLEPTQVDIDEGTLLAAA